ncbi:KH-domain/beta-lactamase-domain protein, archaea [Parasponia andersonii]|uniref:KH-domain/beta-lactamase-domain protein, archaea n=1 Tax=Parasponia andersonii TaxID=3476 RepID=A0A2P5DZ35_PARAD|nr:KH-domain/beta-lactamase-domain protein, archaea [Parasponia andersonii]
MDSFVARDEDKLVVISIGAGCEVGRSFRLWNSSFLLKLAALPYFDEIDPSTIDVLLITHFHLDHASSLPYFLKKTTFEGQVFMTYAIKTIYKLLLTDYIKVSKFSMEDMLFDEQDINRSMNKIEGGRVLIPEFALGHSQELLLILDEIRNAKSNPFVFKHISPLKSIESFKDVGPSVVMASPNGLQSGLLRQLFDMWCSNNKNSCVIASYVVEGTQAKTIIDEPKEVTLMNDFAQMSLEELRPPNVILVHGEANKMGRLKQKPMTQFADYVKLGENGKLVISVDGNVALLDKQSGDVESENEGLKKRVGTTFHRIQNAIKPIPLSAS